MNAECNDDDSGTTPSVSVTSYEGKSRKKQQWGYPHLLSRADKVLQVEFQKLSMQYPHEKTSQLNSSVFIPVCKIVRPFLIPLKEVRRRYAEYRSDPAASAYTRKSMKLHEALKSINPREELCKVISGKWSSSCAGMTVSEGWIVRIETDGSTTYEHADDGISLFCSKLEWVSISGNKCGALCMQDGGVRWRLNYQQSRDDYLVWILNRTIKHDSPLSQLSIVYERLK